MNTPTSLFDLSLTDVRQWLRTRNEPSFRAEQIWNWLYQKRSTTFAEMLNLPQALRQHLEEAFRLGRLKPLLKLTSGDKSTQKILFELPDHTRIETVHMAYRANHNTAQRHTLCISSQVGCALGCTFCATGQGGFKRNLTSGEIVEQVLFFQRILATRGKKVTNIVFMGMGEPFANYDNVIKAVATLTHPQGVGLGARRLTISTSGLVPGIERFTQENSQVNLAISLHAASDALRSRSMPVNRRYPIPVLLDACRKYTEKTHRRISFEWAMIKHVNDTVEQATLLGEHIQGMLCHVNLIPLNPTQGFDGQASDPGRIAAFRAVLNRYGVPNSIRSRKGVDINAACGQLSQTYDR